MKTYCEGFDPVCSPESRVLILGSFPSVKSRAEGFYYGNPQNAFWRTVAQFFGEQTPRTVEEKKFFLSRNRIALWDVVISCYIEGSSDASIERERVADIPALLAQSNVKAVLCNGSLSYRLLVRYYPQYEKTAKKLPSTSPANPRFQKEAWFEALREIFL